MTFLDFFSGIGGFRMGMEMAGHTCLGHCEIDKYADASYRMMHTVTEEQRQYILTLDKKKRLKEIRKGEYLNGEWYAEDIRTVRDVPRADIYCFGFPCQAFSIAGLRNGFEDTRGTLFFEVMRLARQYKPPILFAENVKGLLNHNNGKTFETILRAMDESGYDAEWQVLNSKDYVPQNRERIFLIGHLRRASRREVFPVIRADEENSVEQIGKLTGTPRDNPQRKRVYGIDGIAPTLNCMSGGGLEPHIKDVYPLPNSNENK